MSQGQYIKMAVYGEPGVGKTVFAASADRAILIDVEGGALSVQKRINSKKVIHKRFENFVEIEEYIMELRDKPSKAETIIIDSITELQKKLMDWVVESHPEIKRPYGDGLTIGDWGYNIERMRRFIRMVRDMPYNVIFTALPQDQKNEVTGALKTKPSLSGKLTDDFCGYVDIVGYLYTDSATDENGNTVVVRRLLTQPVGSIYAKDRSGMLDMVIDNPVFSDVYNAVFGNQQEGE